MAVKNHQLDQKIILAAKAEFMEHGFRDASVRNIAQRAGLSTGAIYTRYENKDVLFRSLVEQAFQEIGREFVPMKARYLQAMEIGTPDSMLEVIRREEQLYREMLLRHYEECILFFCRSGGSSVEQSLKMLLDQKAGQTVEYFRKMGSPSVDFDAVRLILSEQLNYYRRILETTHSKEKTISCMDTVAAFLEAGWKELFCRMWESPADLQD